MKQYDVTIRYSIVDTLTVNATSASEAYQEALYQLCITHAGYVSGDSQCIDVEERVPLTDTEGETV